LTLPAGSHPENLDAVCAAPPRRSETAVAVVEKLAAVIAWLAA